MLDADECTADAGEVSERARFLAGQLASVDDPYDVVDAVELAESLDGDHPDGRREALLTAWALTCPGDPLGDPGALFGWLSRASTTLLADHGAAVASMILGATPSARQLRWIDQAITQRLIGLDAASVRGQLLAAELAEVGPAPRRRPSASAPSGSAARPGGTRTANCPRPSCSAAVPRSICCCGWPSGTRSAWSCRRRCSSGCGSSSATGSTTTSDTTRGPGPAARRCWTPPTTSYTTGSPGSARAVPSARCSGCTPI